MHPLEAISSRIKELHAYERKIDSTECVAAYITELRFSDKYHHVILMKEFINEQKLPLSAIPRFLGHRLHIIFKLSWLYFTIFNNLKFVHDLKATDKTIEKLRNLLTDEAAAVKLQVLGIVGKRFSGPWMKTFYTDLNKSQSPINTMHIVKDVIQNLSQFVDSTNML